MTRILFAYGVSGFVSLGYQVAWFRVFTDRFGSTNLTFALVAKSSAAWHSALRRNDARAPDR